ncbi:MAG: LamG-like jellyroll fold domain-containing protein [Deltaproteobacteria bacterium]
MSASWNNAGSGGGYIAQVSSKILADLDNTRRLTLEVVVDLDDATGFGSRLVHIGTGSTTYLGLIIEDGSVTFPINGSTSIQWNIAVGSLSGPTVLTVVFDSTQSNINNRIDFYVNGSPGPTSQFGPAQNQSFDLASTDNFVIGNRPNGSRSIEGEIGYVAIYDRRLSQQEVADNATALLVSHDTR